MEKHIIKPDNNYVWYVEEIFGGHFVAKEGIYLGTYLDFKGHEFAIVTATESIDSLVVRHLPQAEVYTDRDAAILKAAQCKINKKNI